MRIDKYKDVCYVLNRGDTMDNIILEALKSRRSIRKYKQEPIRKEELEAILEAGTYAPTAMGKQAPLIVAVTNPETVALLSKLNAQVMNGTQDPFYGAPIVVVVFGNSESNNCIQDASCVMSNLLNAAHALNIGSCWINRAREVFESDEGKALKKQWGIPEHYIGVANCILGYIDSPYPKAKERKEDYIRIIE